MDFEAKNLATHLLDALRAKGLSLEKLSQASGVSERFLHLLIEGEFKNMPSMPYVHGYLLKIGEVLGLDGEKMWREYLKNSEEVRRSGKNDELPKNRFIVSRVNKKLIIAVVIVLVLIGYALTKVPSFLSRPALELQGLERETTHVKTNYFKVTGHFDPNHQLTLNGERIYPDKEGNFEQEVMLQPGFNTLTLSIKKFLGKDYIIKKQVFYEVPAEIRESTEIELIEDDQTEQLETNATSQ